MPGILHGFLKMPALTRSSSALTFRFPLSLPLQEIGKSKVGQLKLTPRATEVLQEVLTTWHPGVRSTLLSSYCDTQWPDRGARKERKTIFPTFNASSSLILSPPLCREEFRFLSFLFVCEFEGNLDLRRIAPPIGVQLLVLFGSHVSSRKSSWGRGQACNESDSRFSHIRRFFVDKELCLRGALLACRVQPYCFLSISCYNLLIPFPLTFNCFLSEHMNSVWFFNSRLSKSIYFLLLLPWELKTATDWTNISTLSSTELGNILNVAKKCTEECTCVDLY